MRKNKLTPTNKFGLALIVLSVAAGIAIFMKIGISREMICVGLTLIIGAVLFED